MTNIKVLDSPGSVQSRSIIYKHHQTWSGPARSGGGLLARSPTGASQPVVRCACRGHAQACIGHQVDNDQVFRNSTILSVGGELQANRSKHDVADFRAIYVSRHFVTMPCQVTGKRVGGKGVGKLCAKKNASIPDGKTLVWIFRKTELFYSGTIRSKHNGDNFFRKWKKRLCLELSVRQRKTNYSPCPGYRRTDWVW